MMLRRATYRIQLGPDFDLDAAAGMADYLAALGVSHLYLSPLFQAAPASRHGYDVVDPTRVSEALGGEAAHTRLTAALCRHGLGQLLDVVPNHMAISTPDNALWWDVLRSGPSSRFAHFFDVDWDPPEAKLRSRILLPILEDHYGRVLERGLIGLRMRDGGVVVVYRDRVLPLAPRSLPLLLAPAAEACRSRRLAYLGRAFGRLPEPALEESERRRERYRDLQVIEGELRRLVSAEAGVAAAVEEAAGRTAADPDALDELLELQHYRLAYWRAGIHELDYRRFFDVDTLVALRMEDDEVFQHVHGKVLAWLRDDVVDAVRIDHPDGLRRPRAYLERLRAAAPRAWILVEKILQPDEALPDDWPVDGTTGYDFLNEVGGLFLDAGGEAPLTELYVGLTGEERPWRDIVTQAKRQVLAELLAPDLERLTQLFVNVCQGRRQLRDYTRPELRVALTETAAHLSAYRAYVDGERPAARPDRELVEAAIQGARSDRPDLDEALMAFLRGALLCEGEATGPGERELMLRFQQLTGAVTAKAVEDTAFYAWVRMAALNEVGGDPQRFTLSPTEFHRRCASRQEGFPNAMTALSTHDTKRSEDVRARLFLLSELPEAWSERVRRWTASNDRHRRGSPHPDRNLEYLLYQTLVGAHPISRDRVMTYMEKASREAKTHTSWTSPDPDYDRALATFLEGLLDDAAFHAELERFVGPLVEPGWVNALAQKLVQLTAPGVPDLYQGSELWELSLVDPDNRRPVDFPLRRRLLAELAPLASSPEQIWARRREGLPKLWVVRQALGVRGERPEAFGAAGNYHPLATEGPAADHVVAFARGGEVVTVVPRLGIRLREAGGWRDTVVALPAGRWSDRLTGDRWQGGATLLPELLARFPVALLARER